MKVRSRDTRQISFYFYTSEYIFNRSYFISYSDNPSILVLR
jgi:hypothetical protein